MYPSSTDDPRVCDQQTRPRNRKTLRGQASGGEKAPRGYRSVNNHD
ncbi:MAG TPA: hypothetical protein VF721_08160 [Pyrinomonadaceae bacterium]